MIQLKSIKFNQILKKIKKFAEFLAEKNFLFFLVMFLVISFLGLFIFYYYAFLIETSNQAIKEEKPLELDMEKQTRVLEEWQKRNENFHAADFKEYSDPFHGVD